MWDLTRIDGTAGSGSETFIWTAELSASSLAEKSERAKREIEARHDPKTGKWMLKATGHPTTEHEVLQDALEAGRAIALAAEASLEADAFATTGLSKEKWRFDRFGFERVSDRDDRIWPSANGWQARIGWVRLPETATAAEAEALLEATPHLPSERLHVLDQAYARTCYGWSGSQHGAALALEAAGMIEEVQNDAGTMWAITPKGVEALDADPRSVPTRVREVVYAQGAAISQDRTPADLRAEWNSWFGTDVHSGENSAGLLMALENEFELYEGQVQDDPCEIAVFAEGEFPNGTRLGRDFSIMLLSPWWSEDANSSSLFAKAVVESRQEMIDAFNAGRTHPAP